MYRFSVWAPKRKRVQVNVNGRLYDLKGPDTRGCWQVEVDDVEHGASYSYRLDDDADDRPDPRSAWQPEGVHAASLVYDHSRFQWSDARFQPIPIASAIVYELHIGTFTQQGTFDSAIERLDALAELGITHVELLPVASFEGHHGWGYDGVALFAPHEAYGGPDALKRLVDACHARGLAVLLDVVYNHFGPSGNYTGLFGPYTTKKHTTPWGEAINFESTGADQVRRFFVDNALMWMRDYHFDGLRLDAVHEFIDRSAIHILEQLSTEVEDLSAVLGKKLTLIAESDLNDPRIVAPREGGGYGIDAQWSDDFHHALFSALSGETKGYYHDFGGLSPLAKSIECVFVHDGRFSEHRHRIHGRPVTNLSFHHFLGYIQNHDQVGNRAQGDRLAQIISFERAQIAAAIVFTAPFVPMIFQGEEWAASTPFQYFADHQDPALRRGVAEGRKKEFASFGWKPEDVPDPEDPATFERSKLHWDERSAPPHDRMLGWYRALIQLRRTTLDLNHGDHGSVEVFFSEEQQTIRMRRGNTETLVNLGNAEQTLSTDPIARVLLTNRPGVAPADGNISLPAETVAILVYSK
jgi:maltooligosyltrehalose trehalohydrolase